MTISVNAEKIQENYSELKETFLNVENEKNAEHYATFEQRGNPYSIGNNSHLLQSMVFPICVCHSSH